MLTLKDLKKYPGHLPVRMERERTLEWAGSFIGDAWLDSLWLCKFNGHRVMRCRYGELNEVQYFTKDKTWRGIPVSLFLEMTRQDASVLGDDFWSWVQREKIWCGIQDKTVHAVSRKKSTGSILDL